MQRYALGIYLDQIKYIGSMCKLLIKIVRGNTERELMVAALVGCIAEEKYHD